MINVYICEDNPHRILDSVKQNDTVGLYFLDIDLKTDMNGMVLARELRKLDPRGFIVFITSHSELSFVTFNFKVEALDYILKDEPGKLQSKIRECIFNVNEKHTSFNNKIQKNFVIKIKDRSIVVDYQDILFFETSSNIHKVILHSKERKIEFIAKLKDIEVQLDNRFYRCHRSYLVNKDNIKEIDSAAHIITMNNGSTCLISSRMMKGLKASLTVSR